MSDFLQRMALRGMSAWSPARPLPRPTPEPEPLVELGEERLVVAPPNADEPDGSSEARPEPRREPQGVVVRSELAPVRQPVAHGAPAGPGGVGSSGAGPQGSSQPAPWSSATESLAEVPTGSRPVQPAPARDEPLHGKASVPTPGAPDPRARPAQSASTEAHESQHRVAPTPPEPSATGTHTRALGVRRSAPPTGTELPPASRAAPVDRAAPTHRPPLGPAAAGSARIAEPAPRRGSAPQASPSGSAEPGRPPAPHPSPEPEPRVPDRSVAAPSGEAPRTQRSLSEATPGIERPAHTTPPALSPTVVRVTIGRVTVRVAGPTAPQRAAVTQPSGPSISLEQYLDRPRR